MFWIRVCHGNLLGQTNLTDKIRVFVLMEILLYEMLMKANQIHLRA